MAGLSTLQARLRVMHKAMVRSAVKSAHKGRYAAAAQTDVEAKFLKDRIMKIVDELNDIEKGRGQPELDLPET